MVGSHGTTHSILTLTRKKKTFKKSFDLLTLVSVQWSTWSDCKISYKDPIVRGGGGVSP